MIANIKDLWAKTFNGGLHIKDYKWITEDLPIKQSPLPKKVRIPLNQHVGKPALPIVKVGDLVKTGTLIASAQGVISSNIHSSITGKVTAISKFPVPSGGESLAVEIEIAEDASDQLQLLDGDDSKIIQRVVDAGIVGMGGAMFPTGVKLQPPSDKKIDAVILNCAECEPYITCDYRLIIEIPDMVISGLRIVMQAVNVKKGYIGIESNKPNAIELVKERLKGTSDIEVVELKTKYPQGGEKQLIKAILNREVPSGKLPFDVGVIVQNVGTVVAIHEAVKMGKPLYERIVTVTGSCINKPANWRVRIGTMFSDLIEWSGGLNKEAGKIIMGGPMMGIAQYTSSVPVIKGTNGILVLSEGEIKTVPKHPCIRCGKCVIHCPMKLDPRRLATLIENEKFDEAEEAGVMDCIECGLCAYSCSSDRDIVQLIKYAKKRIHESKGLA